MQFEIQLIHNIQQVLTSSSLLIAIAIFLARWLIYVFVAFALFLIISKQSKQRHAAFEAAWSALLALAVTSLVAAIIERPRPFLLPPEWGFEITRLIPIPFNSSFPSGHTSAAFAMASALVWADRRWGAAALLAALAVGFGRMAAGVHYFSDVLGGIAVGLGSFLVVRFLHGQLRKKDLARSAKLHKHS